MSFFWKIYSLPLAEQCQVIIAATGVATLTHLIQDSRKVQRGAADALEQKQRLAAVEKKVRQLDQAKAAPSGWFSGWR